MMFLGSLMKSNRDKWFVVIFIGFFIFLFILVSIFNYAINPYGMFDGVLLPGINDKRVSRETHRMIKPYEVKDENYDAVVLGSSRSLAMDVSHEFWSGYRAYNYGISAASMYEIFRDAQHANNELHLKKVLLGLDMLSFVNSRKEQYGFDETRLSVTADGEVTRSSAFLRDYMAALFSVKAISDSIEDIRFSMKKNPEISVPVREKFLAIDRSFMLPKFGWVSAEDHGFHLGLDAKTGYDPVAYYAQFLEMCYRDNIDLTMYISPLYVHLQMLLHVLGFQDESVWWRKELVRINKEIAARYSRNPYPIWDFTDINEYTTEAIPDEPSASMRWYAESSHFTREYGIRMMDAMSEKIADQIVGFGERIDRLTEVEISDRQMQIHARVLAYSAGNPREAKQIEGMAIEQGLLKNRLTQPAVDLRER